jgi:hypothetical protein
VQKFTDAVVQRSTCAETKWCSGSVVHRCRDDSKMKKQRGIVQVQVLRFTGLELQRYRCRRADAP